jgi:hypothetical protein
MTFDRLRDDRDDGHIRVVGVVGPRVGRTL